MSKYFEVDVIERKGEGGGENFRVGGDWERTFLGDKEVEGLLGMFIGEGRGKGKFYVIKKKRKKIQQREGKGGARKKSGDIGGKI